MHIIDSLNTILKSYGKDQTPPTLADTNKIKILNKLSFQYFRISDNENMFINVTRANELCLKLFSVPSYSNNYTLKREFGRSYHYLSNYYEIAGMLPKAFDNYYTPSKLNEQIGDKNGIPESTHNGGNLYKEQGDLTKALELYTRVLKVRETILNEIPENKSNIKGIANGYNNIGLLYKKLKKYDVALDYFFTALKIKKDINDNLSAANSLGNIGTTYTEIKNYPLALEYFLKALKIYEEYGDKRGASSVYYNISLLYASEVLEPGDKQMNEHIEEAKKNTDHALRIAQQVGDISLLKDCYETLSQLAELKKDYPESMRNYRLYIAFRDSLNSSEAMQNMIRAEMNNEFEKKVFIAEQKQEVNNAIHKEEHERQKTLRNLFIVAFACMLIFAGFFFNSFRQKQKDNVLMSQQKKEVELQKSLAEQKQKQIIDSINYARRIQSSILPHHEKLKVILPESFILYIPKDIVSGDFYWFYELPEPGKILIAVADCTGHGVPGAFLSMVGSTLLNEIVVHKQITDPARIIKDLSYGLSLTLMNKDESEIDQDGMDITICVIDAHQHRLTYAAANQLIYIAGEDGLKKVEPQINSPEGIFDITETVHLKSIEIPLRKNDAVYLLTDGFTDQVNDKQEQSGCKLEEALSNLYSLSSAEQKTALEKTFEECKGTEKQIDDILIIGLRV
ncbi:MAG: tetratricopeptide repeat protein [Bacteroidetes bacterium]|nr:tetratricopeptide repeat protein [Bacteroidota bacterium]